MAALRLACAVLAAGLFAPYASARLAARGGISHTDPVILVARVLRGSRSKRAPPTAELVERLVEPGAASLPALLSILETRWVPFSGAPDEKPQSLSAPQRELVLGALERLNANEVIAAVERRLRTAHDPPQIEAGIYALGAAGDSRQLARIVAMVPEEEEGSLAPAVADAAARILGRDPRAFQSLPGVFARAPPRLRRALLEAIGKAADPRALPFLTRLIVEEPEFCALAVAQIRLVGRSVDPEVNAVLAGLLRGRIAGSLDGCPASVLALGELRDAESIPRMIELLAEGSRGMSGNALWALRRISSQSLPGEVELWTSWWERENGWFESELPLAQSALLSGEPAAAAEALRAIAQRTIRRDRLAVLVCEVLDRPEGALRALGCSALADLGSGVAVETLLRARVDDEPTVAAAASAALSALRQNGLPRDAPQWETDAGLEKP